MPHFIYFINLFIFMFCTSAFEHGNLNLRCYINALLLLLCYITLHYITLHYITLHYITLHYITLHYITLHYNNKRVCIITYAASVFKQTIQCFHLSVFICSHRNTTRNLTRPSLSLFPVSSSMPLLLATCSSVCVVTTSTPQNSGPTPPVCLVDSTCALPSSTTNPS